MTGWVLYDREGFERNLRFAQLLCAEGEKRGHKMQTVLEDDITCVIENAKPVIYLKNKKSKPDFVLRRSYNTMLCKHLELMGVRVLNDSDACEKCNNKLKTAQAVSELGVGMAETYFNCRRAPFFPCVVKPASGHGGKNVFMANNEDEFKNAVQAIRNDDIVVQSLEDKGRDLRVYVSGTRIIAGVLRTCNTDFRSNFSLGGNAILHTLTREEKDIALKIAEKFDFDFAGIDLIYRNGKPIFNEIEDVAGCRMLYSNGIENIPEIIFDRVER